MAEERKPVLIIEASKAFEGCFDVRLPNLMDGGALLGKTVGEAMDKAADWVANYKESQSNDRRISELDQEIHVTRMRLDRLEDERRSLMGSVMQQLPIYSLLVPHELELYKKSLASVDPEYINWFEAKYNRTVTRIDLVEAEGGATMYGTPLIWRWHTVANK